MDDLISKQVAIDALFELYEYQRDIDPTEAADLVRQGIYLAEKKVEQLPSAERKGKWINHRNDCGHNIADCSECGSTIQWFDDDEKPKFCCMCGSRNKEEEEDEDIH